MAAEATAAGSEGETPGIFNWARDRRTWLHFSIFFWVSVIVHGSGFYLFKVVYPPPVRVEPEPGAITFLNQSDPGVRTILQRLQDRTVFILPPSERTDVRVELSDHRVRFVPAFRTTEMELKRPPESDPTWNEIGVIEPVGEIRSGSAVEITTDEALAQRVLAPWSIIRDYLGMAESFPGFRAEVEVSPEGSVDVVEVESNLEAPDEADLSDVIESTVRFLPSKGVDRGWIDVQAGG